MDTSYLVIGILLAITLYLFRGSSDSSKYVQENKRQARECTTEFTTCDKLVAEPGDLIEFQRKIAFGISLDSHSHWAVYVGDNQVIHLTSNIIDGVVILMEKVEKVARGDKCRVNNLEDAAKRRKLEIRPKHLIEAAAFKYLSQSKSASLKYSVTESNCEHFVTLCAFGTPFSEQADNVKDKPTLCHATYFIDSSVKISNYNSTNDDN